MELTREANEKTVLQDPQDSGRLAYNFGFESTTEHFYEKYDEKIQLIMVFSHEFLQPGHVYSSKQVYQIFFLP